MGQETSGSSSVDHQPGARWEFDGEVANVFEDMLRRSIPDYETVRELTNEIALALLARLRPEELRDARVLDLGCSDGLGLESLALAASKRFGLETLPALCGFEISEPMIERAKERVARLPLDLQSRITVTSCDITASPFLGSPVYAPSFDWVAVSFLTLMFLPVEYRPQILRSIYRRLSYGGGLVIVEKCLHPAASTGQILTEVYHRHKASRGYSPESIERKARALEGVLVPLPATATEELLREAGFRVELFWRRLAFSGWLAIKDER